MEKGYFNKSLTPEEISLSRYIAYYVSQHSKKNLTVTRLAKIAIHCVLKLRLPIRMYWYKMGIHPTAQPQVPTTYDFEFEKGLLHRAIIGLDIKKLDETIDEGSKIYSENLDSDGIRRAQYEFLDDKLYLAILDLEIICKEKKLTERKERFFDLLTELLIHLPDNFNYKSAHEIVHEFSVLTNSLLYDCKINREVEEDIINSIHSIINYITALNAKYKIIPGYESQFIREIDKEFIEQKLWDSKNSLYALHKDVALHIKKEITSFELDSTLKQELFLDSLNFFVR